MEPHDCNWFEFAYSKGAACINERCPGHRAMRVLAANLSIGAALCASFDLGRSREACPVPWGGWWPGCGKAAKP